MTAAKYLVAALRLSATAAAFVGMSWLAGFPGERRP